MKQPITHICKHCSLFVAKESICGVNIMQQGEIYEVTVQPQDKCLWEELGIEVKQIRMWSDGKNGYIETTK